jgi:hypothetical protein
MIIFISLTKTKMQSPRFTSITSSFATWLVVFSLVLSTVGVAVPAVNAASLTGLSDTMSSLTINEASSHVLTFTTPTGASDNTDTIIITFPSDFDFTGKTIGTVTFTHGATTGLESTEVLAAAPSATDWGAVFSGTENRILTLTAPTDGVGAATLAANDKVIITYDSTNALNPSTAGSYAIAYTGTFGDVGGTTVRILNDDQVSVTGTVDQTLTFSISDNTIGFGTLSSSNARFATGDTLGNAAETEAHTLAVSTNAVSGYTTTVQGATLTYSGATITAIGGANTASATGTEQFGLRMTATGGSGAVSAPYAAAGYAYAATAGTSDEVAASTVSSDTTTYSVRYLANIAGTTDAGVYTTTLTYLTTANF